MGWFIEAPNNKSDACRPQPQGVPSRERPTTNVSAVAALNNTPSVFVLISSAAYQIDGSRAASWRVR